MSGRIVAVSTSGAYEALPPGEEAALWVLHLDRARAKEQISAIPGAAPIVGVLAGADLAVLVEVWQLSDRLVAVVADAATVDAVAARVLGSPSSPKLETRMVGDHDAKLRALSDVSIAADRLPAALIEPIEQCTDELLMNALYAAPVDAEGKHVFSGISVKRRVDLMTDQQVALQFGMLEHRFMVRITDAFGSLTRDTLLRVLHKGLHADEKVDRKVGGAGLGMFLIATSASEIHVEVVPGVSCQVTCIFASNTARPAALSFVRRDAAGRPRTAPARVLTSPAAKRRRRNFLLGTAGIAAAAGVLVACALAPSINRIAVSAPRGTVVEVDGRLAGTVGDDALLVPSDNEPHLVIARLAGHASDRRIVRAPGVADFTLAPLATVEIDSQPQGARVEAGGALLGTTPLLVTSFAPKSRVAITLTKPGYKPRSVDLDVPAGGRTKIAQPLERAPDLVRVRLTTNPPGAQVQLDGRDTPDRTYTPADVYVPVNTTQHFVLSLHGYAPQTVDVSPKPGDADLVVNHDLVEARDQ